MTTNLEGGGKKLVLLAGYFSLYVRYSSGGIIGKVNDLFALTKTGISKFGFGSEVFQC